MRLTLTRPRSPSPAATHIFLSTNVGAGIQSDYLEEKVFRSHAVTVSQEEGVFGVVCRI